MCEMPSYYEHEGSVWSATDDLVAKYLRNHPDKQWEDMTGHSGLLLLFPEIPMGAIAREGVGPKTPPDVVAALKSGRMDKMLAVGNLRVLKDVTIELKCTTIGGYVCVGEGGKLNAPACATIGGYVRVYEGGKLNAPACATIGGSVSVYEGGTFNAPLCTTIGGSVSVYEGGTFNAPLCTTIGGSMSVGKGGEFNAPACTTIGGSVNVYEGGTFNAPLCTTIGGSMSVGKGGEFNAPMIKRDV